MHLMHDKGITNQTITNIMPEVLDKAGKFGEFLASTIENINMKCQAAMDEIAKIMSDMYIAEETMGGAQ